MNGPSYWPHLFAHVRQVDFRVPVITHDSHRMTMFRTKSALCHGTWDDDELMRSATSSCVLFGVVVLGLVPCWLEFVDR
jgi:hypothetical protein